MDTKPIFDFLRDIAENNNRPWFQEHKAEYEKAKVEFEKGVADAITTISKFDPSVSHLTVKTVVIAFIAIHDSALTSRPINAILAPISPPGVRNRYMEAIIFTFNPVIVCWLLAVTGCLQIFLLR